MEKRAFSATYALPLDELTHAVVVHITNNVGALESLDRRTEPQEHDNRCDKSGAHDARAR